MKSVNFNDFVKNMKHSLWKLPLWKLNRPYNTHYCLKTSSIVIAHKVYMDLSWSWITEDTRDVGFLLDNQARGYRKKMNLLTISRFPDFIQCFPDFSQRFPESALLVNLSRFRKCERCGSLNPRLKVCCPCTCIHRDSDGMIFKKNTYLWLLA